ncbi:MAG: hypothetical protein GC161_07850 [Planctomycetaceae bacterium]|nr:hypothetical protein [Planctomycetaceae bacterium]
MNTQQKEFLLEALETELGGVKIYETSLRCVRNKDLKKEFEKYLDETKEHVQVYTDLLEALGIDSEIETPGREVVRKKGAALVQSMELALETADPAAAELVAAECVVDAETKCHLNWHLVGELADALKGEEAKHLSAACEAAEDQEDEHLYHSAGWARELWIQRLGMDAVLPPPEEEKHVKTAIGAARARKARKELL